MRTTANDAPLIHTPNAVNIADVDAVTNEIQLALSVTNGSFTLGSPSGLTFLSGSGTNSSSLLIWGTLANINAALSGLTFVRAGGFVGIARFDLSVSDLGNSGLGGAKTASKQVRVTVTA